MDPIQGGRQARPGIMRPHLVVTLHPFRTDLPNLVSRLNQERGGNLISPRRVFLACFALLALRPVALMHVFSFLLGSRTAAVKTGIAPLFQQRNAAHQLRDGRLINPAAGSLDEFCIELAMIDTGLSGHGADEGAMLVS